MVSIPVPFPDDLRHLAEEAARERCVPLDEFVRQCVSIGIQSRRESDPLFADSEVFQGDSPADLAENHDHYLYGSDA
jgi:hypothetical protein